MEIIDLSKQNTLLNQFVSEIRDVNIQTDRLRFRANIKRIGQVMAYEISKRLNYATRSTVTPLGAAQANVPADRIVLCTILRAGLPLHEGFLSYYDQAENAFVSAYREESGEELNIKVEYIASPSIEGKTLLIVDPMLATGGSLELSYRAMLTKGNPAKVHVASVIASKQAVEHLEQVMPESKTTIWCAAIDPSINEHSYIVPGLGDAGDLAFGEK